MPDLKRRLEGVRATIDSAERAHHRAPGSVVLVAASKAQPASAIRALAALGVRDFGENYVQEALAKQAELADLALRWHFIGRIQSNKTRDIARHFHWVHSVDRVKIAQRLADQRPAELPPLNICLEVNLDREHSKGGFAPAELADAAFTVAALGRLRLRGLMAIPAPREGFAAQRRIYATLREFFERLRAAGLDLDTLSMGMSGDIEAAVAEGATMVRVGTALFGPRPAR